MRFYNLSGVVETVLADSDGNVTITTEQDCEPILDGNRELANGGFSRRQDMWPVASIPLNLIEKWRNEEGIDVFDPNCADALKRKLNSIEYRYLRTGEHVL